MIILQTIFRPERCTFKPIPLCGNYINVYMQSIKLASISMLYPLSSITPLLLVFRVYLV